MNTIKSLSILLSLLLAASLTSCQKDKIGVYAPNKQIKQIYYSSSHSDKQPFQHWEWNDKQLNSITHYESGFKANAWIENFTYENDRVVRVDNYTNSEYITYEYDGDHLKSATVFYRNVIVCTWSVSYEGDKISKLMGAIYDSDYKDGDTLHLNPLSHMLPPTVCENVMKCEQQMTHKMRQKDTFTIAILLTWTDDNISKLVFTGDGEYIDMQLQYDDQNCPYHGFMGGLEDYVINFTLGHAGFTKNNVTTLILTEGHYTDTIRYAYQYDSDNYPILQTLFNVDNIDNKEVLYFEY